MEALSSALSRLLREHGLERPLQGWRAVDGWAEWVGARIARHTRAVGFRDGTLIVEVEGSAWMQELGFLKREIIRTLNERVGASVVQDVRFTVPRGGSLR
jgi:predicted nucleic acid-binding Zn ribbon protein